MSGLTKKEICACGGGGRQRDEIYELIECLAIIGRRWYPGVVLQFRSINSSQAATICGSVGWVIISLGLSTWRSLAHPSQQWNWLPSEKIKVLEGWGKEGCERFSQIHQNIRYLCPLREEVQQKSTYLKYNWQLYEPYISLWVSCISRPNN